MPAAGFLQDSLGKQESGAGNGAAAAQRAARPVQVAALPQKPQGISGTNPVAAVVFAVAVAGDNLIACCKALVHPLDKVGGQQVIRVKDQIGVKALRVVLPDMFQQRLQRIPLADILPVKSLIHHRSLLPGHIGGRIGAVIRDHKSFHQ